MYLRFVPYQTSWQKWGGKIYFLVWLSLLLWMLHEMDVKWNKKCWLLCVYAYKCTVTNFRMCVCLFVCLGVNVGIGSINNDYRQMYLFIEILQHLFWLYRNRYQKMKSDKFPTVKWKARFLQTHRFFVCRVQNNPIFPELNKCHPKATTTFSGLLVFFELFARRTRTLFY